MERKLARRVGGRLRAAAPSRRRRTARRTSTCSPAAPACTSRRSRRSRRAATLTLGADAAVDLTSCGLGLQPRRPRPAVSWDAQDHRLRGARHGERSVRHLHDERRAARAAPSRPTSPTTRRSGNGLLEHDFDPAFSPPGPDGKSSAWSSRRRAATSTRSAFDYSGPQRTPEDPTKPNANLYVLGLVEQRGQSRAPAHLAAEHGAHAGFMQDGRLVFTAEKREPNFYELALRRQNLDGSDYHPLYSQRGSIGYPQATYVVELSHKNFAAIFSDQNAVHGAGALGVFNRSLGVDFTSTDPERLPGRPDRHPARARASAVESNFFLHSLTVLASDGSYTSPSTLPDGQILVSFGSGAPDSLRRRLRPLRARPRHREEDQAARRVRHAPRSRPSPSTRACAKGIFVGTGDEPNGNTTIAPGRSERGHHRARHEAPGLAALPEHAHGPRRRARPRTASRSTRTCRRTSRACPRRAAATRSCDAFGKVYVRRRKLGTRALLGDGSAHFRIPGGLPMVLHLAGRQRVVQSMKLPRWQREEMTFVPGETRTRASPGSSSTTSAATATARSAAGPSTSRSTPTS